MVRLLQVSDTAMILHLHLKQKKPPHSVKYLINPLYIMLDVLWALYKIFLLLLTCRFLSIEKMIGNGNKLRPCAKSSTV